MKNICLSICLLLFFSLTVCSQEYESQKVIQVFNVKNKSAQHIYKDIYKWIALNYNSANNVLQMKDMEQGLIIVKGVNKIPVNSNMSSSLKQKNSASNSYYFDIGHTLEVNIKDNKYRLIYTFKRPAYIPNSPYNFYNNLFWDCIDLKFNKTNEVSRYNTFLSKRIKSLKIKGKRGQKLKELINKNIIKTKENIKAYSFSLFKEINNSLKIKDVDDW